MGLVGALVSQAGTLEKLVELALQIDQLELVAWLRFLELVAWVRLLKFVG